MMMTVMMMMSTAAEPRIQCGVEQFWRTKIGHVQSSILRDSSHQDILLQSAAAWLGFLRSRAV